MKKLTLLLLIPLLLSSCVIETDEADIVPLSESLKISTWVLDEKYENNGYWEYDFEDWDDRGRWVSDDGTVIEHADDVYELEVLELNVPRTMAHFGYGRRSNLNIRIESDDVINVKAEVRGNDDIVIAYSPSSPDEVISKDWVTSNNFTVVGSFTFNALPIGKIIPTDTRNGLLVQPHTLVGKEYYIDINTYTLDSRPRVTAQLKLTVIEDEHCPPPTGKGYIHGAGDDLSRFVRIELVKFGYSDTALHDEFERYDHLYN